MKLATRIRPISYLKAHAAEVVRELGAGGPSMVITQNGEAKAVIQDIRAYEQTQEAMALLKILALGQQQIATGKVHPLGDALAKVKSRRRERE